MKRIVIAKIMGASAALILLFNLLFSSYNNLFSADNHTKSGSGLSINTITGDDAVFSFEKEDFDEEEDTDEEPEFLSFGFQLSKHEPVILIDQVSSLKDYSLTLTPKQSLPRWLLVRHILI